ncbi:MAG: exosortase/archaeosortase family protein [Phycisphaerales bacterium JB063]
MKLIPRALLKNGWTRADAARIVAALFAAAIATYPAWVHLFKTAIRYDHSRPIVLVPLIAAWLVWVRRSRFRYVRPGEFWPGWIMLAAGAQLFYMGNYWFGLKSAWYLGAVLMVGGALVVTTGASVIRQFRPAWLVLMLLVPIPVTLANVIALPIQIAEARAITFLYGLIGIDTSLVEVSGSYLLTVGSAVLPIENACKGLATAMSLFLICYGFVFGAPLRMPVRVGLLVLSPLIALLCSALALLCTLWVYAQTEMVTADTVRAVSEWATILLGFMLVAALLRALAWASVPVYEYHLANEY